MMQEGNWHSDAKWLDPKDLGKVLVIAPHQDDESLGCGGTIASLREYGLSVHVLFITDGSKSHPNSIKYPFKKLVSLREQESLNALGILGVGAKDVTFLRLPDGALPGSGEEGFGENAGLVSAVLKTIKPQTIFLPWQRDPHRDHRATWQITTEAIKQTDTKVGQLEYLIWLWERADDADLPKPEEVKVWKTDIESVKQKKKDAIKAHVSQTTQLIDDDPEGFTLSEEVLNHFDKSIEIFIERS
ncbi:PIG-L deacetylase family protein [Dyadobacter psychrotolerans]|uniref:PIG-L family deacetylase n=1 Tax=Dyadobacter psychrotolerans TaxID=2541721 RepID=A0A4V2Z343_9BACT|nr:PIG-L family deacetylase [Dyadobacter psychrotolerans]TDE11278.1 PIG-L family deacetylase [Dyadobacter psychrotolerans]